MADKVHLTKHGIQALGWDGEVGQYAERKIPTALEVLRCACRGHLPCGRARSGTCHVDALHLEAIILSAGNSIWSISRSPGFSSGTRDARANPTSTG
jgi:hypothetical protein